MAVVGQSRPLPTGMKAPNLRTPLFIFGVALALVSFLVMFAFGIVFVGRSQATGSVPVVVAKEKIDARSPITPDMLTLSSLPATAVPPTTYLHASDLTGTSATVDILKGQPISSNLVTSNPDSLSPSQTFLPIPQGMVALTVPTNELQGVGGNIAVGDYISVAATVDTSEFLQKPARTVTVPVFDSLYVIRIGPASSLTVQAQKQGVSSSLTVVMSPCDAAYMDWLLVKATLKYELVSYHDYNKTPPTADPTCTAAVANKAITPGVVDKRWHYTSI
jgi:Flp pilus assembly protein CpaB